MEEGWCASTMVPLRFMDTLGNFPCARRGADPAKVKIELDYYLKAIEMRKVRNNYNNIIVFPGHAWVTTSPAYFYYTTTANTLRHDSYKR